MTKSILVGLPDDEIAQSMEDALQFGKGQPYITRNEHGAVLAGQPYRVWRTKAMTVAVLSFTPPKKCLEMIAASEP